MYSVRQKAKRCSPEVIAGRNELAKLYRRIRKTDPWAAREVAKRITTACMALEAVLRDKHMVDFMEACLRAAGPPMPTRSVH